MWSRPPLAPHQRDPLSPTVLFGRCDRGCFTGKTGRHAREFSLAFQRMRRVLLLMLLVRERPRSDPGTTDVGDGAGDCHEQARGTLIRRGGTDGQSARSPRKIAVAAPGRTSTPTVTFRRSARDRLNR